MVGVVDPADGSATSVTTTLSVSVIATIPSTCCLGSKGIDHTQELLCTQ